MDFETDTILANYLLSKGFKETTDEDYRRKGKREFSQIQYKRGHKKRVIFDYINIKIVDDNYVIFNDISIKESELIKLIES